MHILVLDTIHGGREIADAYAGRGHSVDCVDIYKGTTPDTAGKAHHTNYDLIVAPVHMDPDHPLRASRSTPVISHHEAVRRLLGEKLPFPLIEITGTRGKTTTAHALAHILPGKGVLHTSTGTYACPQGDLLMKRSITPASLLAAAACAHQMQGWLVAEISLGVTGAGDLAIITSAEDYVFAAGKKSALREKIASLPRTQRVLVEDSVACDHPHAVHLGEIARCDGIICTLTWQGSSFILKNPLFLLPPYRVPLMLAAAAAMMLGVDPTPLNHFTALPGRMSVSHERGILIVDNANTGTNAATTLCAARYARHLAGTDELTLVIGQAIGDGAVCEGFSSDQIACAIANVQPTKVIRVGRVPDKSADAGQSVQESIDAYCTTLDEGLNAALETTEKGSIVLAVKTWR
jgi:hypothetical protein